jgi:hypothetical protein
MIFRMAKSRPQRFFQVGTVPFSKHVTLLKALLKVTRKCNLMIQKHPLSRDYVMNQEIMPLVQKPSRLPPGTGKTIVFIEVRLRCSQLSFNLA